MRLERREHIRFLPEDNAFIALGTEIPKLGRIANISMGGASFEYIYHKNLSHDSGCNADIFMSPNSFHLPDIPCKIVYDVPVSPDDSPFTLARSVPTRRCGIEFEQLNDNTSTDLLYFLKNYTSGILLS